MERTSSVSTFRARLRIRVVKKLHIESSECRLQIDGREVVLSAGLDKQPIMESEWLIFNTRGFESFEAAIQFGHSLRVAVELASVALRLGVDTGADLATAGLGAEFRRLREQKQGISIRDNVHGLDVFEDSPNVRIVSFSASGTVRALPEPFLPLACELAIKMHGLSERAKDIVILLNYALMRSDPISQIVFAFSAVEMLGQTQDWSKGQRELLAELAHHAEQFDSCSMDERAEVVAALKKGVHRFSLRQGVMRLLEEYGLRDLKPIWDRLYSERSKLVHGLAPRAGVNYAVFAHDVIGFCGRILLTIVGREVPQTAAHLETYYQLPTLQEYAAITRRDTSEIR